MPPEGFKKLQLKSNCGRDTRQDDEAVVGQSFVHRRPSEVKAGRVQAWKEEQRSKKGAMCMRKP